MQAIVDAWDHADGNEARRRRGFYGSVTKFFCRTADPSGLAAPSG